MEEEKKEVKETNELEKINLKGLNKGIDGLTKVGMIISCFLIVVSIVLSVLSTIAVLKGTREEVVKKDYIVEYLSVINDNSKNDMIEKINNDSKGMFIAFEIVIPTLIVVSLLVTIVILCQRILSFIKDVKSEKKLFTREKLKESTNIITSLLYISLMFMLFLSSFLTLLVFLVLDITLSIIYYLFRKCVEYEEKQNNKK